MRSGSASASAAISCDVIGMLTTRGQARLRRRSGRCRDHADQDGAAPLHRQPRHPADAGRRRSGLFDRAQVQAAITDLLRERRSITRRQGGRFQHLRHRADLRHADRHDDAAHRHRRGGGRDQPGRRRHRHHEHHAGVGDRADARDRHPARDRRGGERGADAVPGRGDRAVVPRRAGRAGDRAAGDRRDLRR